MEFDNYIGGVYGFIAKMIITSFFVLLLIVISALYITLEYVGEIETKCYDKFGNEILNLTCKEEVYCSILSNWLNIDIAGITTCPIKEERK